MEPKVAVEGAAFGQQLSRNGTPVLTLQMAIPLSFSGSDPHLEWLLTSFVFVLGPHLVALRGYSLQAQGTLGCRTHSAIPLILL